MYTKKRRGALLISMKCCDGSISFDHTLILLMEGDRRRERERGRERERVRESILTSGGRRERERERCQRGIESERDD